MPTVPPWLSATALCFALTTFAGFSQQTPAQSDSTPAPTIRATTREVILDAVVTTKNGHPVSGLTKDDFVILEEKAPQTIQSFQAVSIGLQNQTVPQPPETILLVDQMNTQFPDFAYARYSMKKLLARNGGKLAQPTTLMALTDKGLRPLAGPTLDGEKLESALEHLQTALPWRLLQPNFYSGVERINLSLGALADIALANAGSGVRKNIVWISPGFPIFSSLQMDATNQQKLFDAIRALSDELLKARIAIYTVDPRGVFPGEIYSNNLQFRAYLAGLQSASGVAFGDLALQKLAIETGGRALYGRNDVDQAIADSIGDGDTYYTLSYSPVNRNFDGQFRKIKISLPQHPELQARTRDGYYALPEPPPPTAESIRTQMNEALTSPLTYKAIPILNTTTTVVRVPSRAHIRLTVAAHSFSWSPLPGGEMQAIVDIAALDIPQKGKSWRAVNHVYRAKFSADQWKSLERQNLAFVIEVPVTLSSDHLRLLVRDETSGQIGTADITNLPPFHDKPPSEYLQHRNP